MLWHRLGRVIILGLAFGWGGISNGLAQEAGTEALGTPLGAFIVYPSLTLDTEYNDNIFATDGGEEDDIIFRIKPEVRVISDWDNHSLQFLAAGDFARYVDHTSENTSGFRFLADGRIDILRDTFATLTAGVAQTFEERGSPDDVNGEKPTKEISYGGGAGLSHRFNRFWIELNGDATWRDFSDVNAAGGGQINNDDRDRIEYSSRQRFGYDFNPDIGAFLQTTFKRVSYNDSSDDFGDSRDSTDYSLSGGMRLDVTDLIFGDVFAGVTRSDFDDSAFASRTTWNIGGNLTWDVTELTSVNFSAARTWEETTVAGASTALTTSAGVTVTHSLTDFITLDGSFNYTREEFEETNRVDNTYSMGPGINYLMNRFLHLRFNYSYTQRKSEEVGQDYIENLFLLSLRLQY